MGKIIKEIERKFIDMKPIGINDLKLLYNKYGVTESQDGLKLYIDIVIKTKPENHSNYYAKILNNSIYDRKAKPFTDKFDIYIKSLLTTIQYNLYDENDSYIVIKHNDSGEYIRLDGYYSSYNGLSFSGEWWYSVTPKEVISIEYTK